MDLNFQQDLLRYLVQQPDGKKYIEHLTDDLFSLVEFQLALQILQQYYKRYKSLPSHSIASAYLKEVFRENSEITGEIKKDLKEVFEDMFVPLAKDELIYLKDHLSANVQDALISNLAADHAEGKITNEQFFLRSQKIYTNLSEEQEDFFADGGFLIADRHKHDDDMIEGHPFFLEDVNLLTAAGGFYSPQLIIFLSGPKSFKTGIILKGAMEYVRNGYKVYYADAENSARSIRNRSKMSVMECTLPELFDPQLQDEMDKVLENYGKFMGGDLFIDNYPANSKCVLDVEARLDFLKEEYGWEPDIIVYDSIDHFLPNKQEDRKRDLRIQISKVYHEAIALNKRKNTFAFAPSQVNRAAVGKKVFTMKDVSESFDKIMNCHAAFAICMTPEEEESGIRRIVPVAQREGMRYTGVNFCVVKIDESKMIVEEVDKDDYTDEEDV